MTAFWATIAIIEFLIIAGFITLVIAVSCPEKSRRRKQPPQLKPTRSSCGKVSGLQKKTITRLTSKR